MSILDIIKFASEDGNHFIATLAVLSMLVWAISEFAKGIGHIGNTTNNYYSNEDTTSSDSNTKSKNTK